MLKHKLSSEFDIRINDQQQKAINHIEGPALTLACPGSGKTTTLLFRTFHLLSNAGIKPQNILSMTFSRAAAHEMEHRFEKLFGSYIDEKVKFSTIHSFGYNVLRNYYEKICNHDFEIVNEKKSKLLKNLYREINHEIINDDKLDELGDAIGFFKNAMISPEEFCQYPIDIPSFKEIFIRYGKFKRENHLIDYDDMLTITLWIFQRYDKILERYRSRYHFIQVDEAQDTSKVQHEIIKLLVKPHNNLFMVADDDQSIYSWRGTDLRFLLDFQKEFINGKIYNLEKNFRSTQDIVESSIKCIQHNKERFNKNMYTDKPSIRKVNVITAKDYADQISYVVNQLKKIEELGDSAILFRKNICAVPLIDMLERNNIKFYIRDHKNGFFTHFAVNDMMNFLKVAIDQNDKDAFIKICYKTNSYISKPIVEHFSNTPAKNIFDALLSYTGLTSIQRTKINELKSHFKILKTKSPKAALTYTLATMEYKESLESYCKMFGYSLDNVYNIISTLSSIAENTMTIDEFLARLKKLEELIKQSTKNRGSNAITLSTLHSSKGLEFRYVFIIDLLNEEFPSKKAIDLSKISNFAELEEERRLFYVGMTRSKEYLDLITVNGRQSQFLNEISDAEEIETPFRINSTVLHTVFGKGTIRAIADSTMTIHFEKHGVRVLDKTIIIKNALLKNSV